MRQDAYNLILVDLSEGKRLVGIISHVTELKAQIGTKLIVAKKDTGSKVKWEIDELFNLVINSKLVRLDIRYIV